jgi:hypothetical protein
MQLRLAGARQGAREKCQDSLVKQRAWPCRRMSCVDTPKSRRNLGATTLLGVNCQAPSVGLLKASSVPACTGRPDVPPRADLGTRQSKRARRRTCCDQSAEDAERRRMTQACVCSQPAASLSEHQAVGLRASFAECWITGPFALDFTFVRVRSAAVCWISS